MANVWFGAGLLAITCLTMSIGLWAGSGHGLALLWAMVRAVVQLGVVAVLIRGIIAVPWTVAGFVLLMLSTASWTAGARLGDLWHGRRIALIGVLVGGCTTLAVIFALHLVEFQTRYVVAVGGIIIGNSMSASTLAGRNFLRAARARVSEVEAWLSLGATPARAHGEIGREAAREALLPNIDQTRSSGLVTLPGAFVGALFGGASPVEAAKFQLVVLAGIALTMTLTSVVVTRLAGRTPYIIQG